MIGIPTRVVNLAEILRNEIFIKTGLNVNRVIIDPTFYWDDQNRVGTRLIDATDIPSSMEKKILF